MYQLSRRAYNASSYSERRVNIGKPIASLRAALLAAMKARGDELRITDTVTGQWASVGLITGYSSWRGVEHNPHVTMELPPVWAAELVGGHDEGTSFRRMARASGM